MRRNIGKMLISLAAILTAVVPFLADWNDSHLFSPQWSPHARFHGAVSLGMTTILSSVALWLLWRRSPDQDASVTVAAAIPMAYWGPFFLAPFVPGTAVEDPGHRLCGSSGCHLTLWEREPPSSLLDWGGIWIVDGVAMLHLRTEGYEAYESPGEIVSLAANGYSCRKGNMKRGRKPLLRSSSYLVFVVG